MPVSKERALEILGSGVDEEVVKECEKYIDQYLQDKTWLRENRKIGATCWFFPINIGEVGYLRPEEKEEIIRHYEEAGWTASITGEKHNTEITLGTNK